MGQKGPFEQPRMEVKRYVDLGATIEDLMEDVTEADAYAKTVDNAHIQHGTQLSKLREMIGKRAPVLDTHSLLYRATELWQSWRESCLGQIFPISNTN